MAEESAHSRLGFSQADRWFECPGSPTYLATLPKKPAGIHAQKGTDAHSLGEWCLTTGKDPDQYESLFIGETTIDAEMLRAVSIYVDYVRSQLKAAGPDAVLLVEQPANLSRLHRDLWGRFDAMILVPFERAEVIDYKNGGGKVYEADCRQGQGYAMHPWEHFDVNQVTFTIVQPNAPHDDGPVRSHTYTRAQLAQVAADFKAHAEACDAPNAPLIAGPWCKNTWCDAQAVCPKAREAAVTVAGQDFQVVPAQTPPAPERLTPAQIRDVLAKAEQIKGWVKAVVAYALSQGLQGNPPEGLKVVEGRKGHRKWCDEAATLKEMEKAGADIRTVGIMTPAKVEEKMGKARWKQFAHLAKQPPGRPMLVALSDKREPMALGPNVEFAEPEDIEEDF